MAVFEYRVDSLYNKEASKITFEVDDDMDIHQYKVICMRMASAMGYSDKSIKASFGDIYDGDTENEFNELIQMVFSGSIETLH